MTTPLYTDARFNVTTYAAAQTFVDARPDYFFWAFAKKKKYIGISAAHHIIPAKLIDNDARSLVDDMNT